MNYGQARDLILKLLNQYTVAGEEYAVTYNNQQDYLNRIPALLNDAMMEIATTMKKIPATMNLNDLVCEERGHTLRFELPTDFYQFESGDTVRTKNGFTFHTNWYAQQGKRFLIIPKAEKPKDQSEYEITYYRYPTLLPEKPADSVPLDNDPETHTAAAYYAASFLVADDSAFLASMFMNKYEDKLAKMSRGISAEVHPTADSYLFSLWYNHES